MAESEFVNRRAAARSYRPGGLTMSPGLLRAREPYRVKNAITGLIIFGFAVGTWAYSLRAVKQDTFDDVDEEARALVGSGAKSLEDEARELEAARKAAAFESAPPARPAGTTPAQGSTEGQRGLLVPLEGTLPRLLDPRGKTLVWGAPSVDRLGRIGERVPRRR